MCPMFLSIHHFTTKRNCIRWPTSSKKRRVKHGLIYIIDDEVWVIDCCTLYDAKNLSNKNSSFNQWRSLSCFFDRENPSSNKMAFLTWNHFVFNFWVFDFIRVKDMTENLTLAQIFEYFALTGNNAVLLAIIQTSNFTKSIACV